MKLNAQVQTDSLGNIIVLMKGGFDYENTKHLENQLIHLTKENPTADITIDMNQVDFVGSSGIGLFVDIIQGLNDKKDQIRLMNVKSEFLKVFKLYADDAFEALVRSFDDDETEFLAQNYAARRKTFQN
ncbi:MAG: STAS domain-containing protein [Bacteriovoracaceae bacterium]